MPAVKIFFLVAGTLLASTATSMADITRSCKTDVIMGIGNSQGWKVLGRIAGQGRCEGKSKANTCRERARDAIVGCIDAMWRDRFKNAIAPECNTLASGRTGAKLTWDSIFLIQEPNRITARIAYWACCTKLPNAPTIEAGIGGAIIGDKGCAASKIGKNLYQSDWGKPPYNIPCSEWREKGICN